MIELPNLTITLQLNNNNINFNSWSPIFFNIYMIFDLNLNDIEYRTRCAWVHAP